MKISLYLPEKSEKTRNFLLDEIAQAQNIKDKQNRKSVIRALGKLLVAIEQHPEKTAFFTDGEELIIEPYEGRKSLYHCGREYERLVPEPFLPYLLVVVDANEAAIGITDGERIKILWHDDSWVPRKHDAGGQSQRRFERGREEKLKHWLRKIVSTIIDLRQNRKMIIGGPGMTKDLLIKEFPS
jgi:peptide chain release factor subunit 1